MFLLEIGTSIILFFIVIKKNVTPGSIIAGDCWRGYSDTNSLYHDTELSNSKDCKFAPDVYEAADDCHGIQLK